MKLFLTLFVVLMLTGFMVFSGHLLSGMGIRLYPDGFINQIMLYQMCLLLISVSVVVVMLKWVPDSRIFFKWGAVHAPATRLFVLGISGNKTWAREVLPLILIISTATSVFMFGGVHTTNSWQYFHWSFIPLALMFSVINAFGEEIVFRFIIIGSLSETYSKGLILLISAAMFGVPHYYGSPGGIIGVLMSVFLGYVLARISMETKGIGLAWFIHFVQDVIIFIALFMMKVR